MKVMRTKEIKETHTGIGDAKKRDACQEKRCNLRT